MTDIPFDSTDPALLFDTADPLGLVEIQPADSWLLPTEWEQPLVDGAVDLFPVAQAAEQVKIEVADEYAQDPQLPVEKVADTDKRPGAQHQARLDLNIGETLGGMGALAAGIGAVMGRGDAKNAVVIKVGSDHPNSPGSGGEPPPDDRLPEPEEGSEKSRRAGEAGGGR